MTAREVQGRRNEGAIMHRLYRLGYVIEFTEPGSIVIHYIDCGYSLPGHDKPRDYLTEVTRNGCVDE